MKTRLDVLLTERGLAPSREKAKAVIMSGIVFVDGVRADKPGMAFDENCGIEVRGSALAYVSRGGLKLEKALKTFGVTPAGKICLDCGASTGGFTDCMLQNGAQKVYAVDVGYGQLAWKLRTDERVVNLERTNLRYVTAEQVPETLDLAVMDVSFISIRLVIPAVRELLKPSGDVICLIKPQFEAGRENVGKKGVVRDAAVHRAVLESFLTFFPEAGFTLMGLDHSPIRGPEGNIEFLAWLKKGVHDAPEFDVSAIVEASHKEFST